MLLVRMKRMAMDFSIFMVIIFWNDGLWDKPRLYGAV